MDRAASSEGDDRLVAVGRALAQSLLAGQDLPVPDRHDRIPSATALVEPPVAPVGDAPTPEASSPAELRTDSFIPPPADVVPGAERMEPPRRRRRSVFEPAEAEWTGPEPTPAQSEPLPPEPLPPEPVRSEPLPADTFPAPQVARVRPPAPDPPVVAWDDSAFGVPAPFEAAPFEAAPFEAAPFEAAPFEAAPHWPEGPAWTGAGTSEDAFDPHAQELFESLPWSKEESPDAGGGRARRRRRGGRPDPSTDELPDAAGATMTPSGSGPELVLEPWDLAPPAAPTPPPVLALAPASDPVATPADHPPRLDDRPAPPVAERPQASGGLSAATAAAWIGEHPVLERPDEATVHLVGPPDEEAPAAPGAGRTALEWGMVLGSAVVVALLVKLFVIQSFSIPSESMYPTLKIGDRVVVNQLAYDVGSDVERFDVIVFRRVEGTGPSRPDDPEFLIKRVIGLPGETIEARGGVVYVDGEPLDESEHLGAEVVTNNITQPFEVPAGHYWVMGDNRERSGDSRIFGPVPKDHVVGRAMAVWWPFDRAGSL